MDHVAEFVKKYSQGLEKGVLLHADFAKDLGRIANEFGTLPAEQQKQATQVLRDIEGMIEAKIVTLGAEAQDVKKRLKASQENARACIAYLNASRGGLK